MLPLRCYTCGRNWRLPPEEEAKELVCCARMRLTAPSKLGVETPAEPLETEKPGKTSAKTSAKSSAKSSHEAAGVGAA